jgi:predicted methyltransferase
METASQASKKDRTMTHLHRTALARAPICILAFSALLATCLAPSVAAGQATPDYAAIVAAPDRSDADRESDKRRDPAPLLAFTGVRPGMKVLDMGAGGGYSTELMARGVAPSGVVYGQNAADFGGRGKERFDARLKTPAMKNAVALARPFDDPVPADVRDLDLITFLFFYHDTTYMEVDRDAMNRKLFAALKPGGLLVIADHSARPGEGTTVSKTNHRIEESVLRREVEAAGFKLVAAGDFWHHPEDTRDFNVNRPTGPVDNFVLKFQKPN